MREAPRNKNNEKLLGNRNSITAPIEDPEELRRRFPDGILHFEGCDKQSGFVLVTLKDEVGGQQVTAAESAPTATQSESEDRPSENAPERPLIRPIIRPLHNVEGPTGSYWIKIPEITYGDRTLPQTNEEKKILRDRINQEIFGIDTSSRSYFEPLAVTLG